jgi:hypothetical protein
LSNVRTSDGWRTWSPLPALPPGVDSVEACTTRACFGRGREHPSTSTDLGQTWAPVGTEWPIGTILCTEQICLGGHSGDDPMAFVLDLDHPDRGIEFEPSIDHLLQLPMTRCGAIEFCVASATGLVRIRVRPVPPPPPPSSIVAIAPVRLLETRTGADLTTIDGQHQATGPLPTGTTYRLPIAGRGTIPTTATNTILTVTATQPDAPGFITIYPCDQPQPNASNLNYTTNQTTANAVTTPLAADGTICIYTLTTTHLLVDANAYTPAA